MRVRSRLLSGLGKTDRRGTAPLNFAGVCRSCYSGLPERQPKLCGFNVESASYTGRSCSEQDLLYVGARVSGYSASAWWGTPRIPYEVQVALRSSFDECLGICNGQCCLRGVLFDS